MLVKIVENWTSFLGSVAGVTQPFPLRLRLSLSAAMCHIQEQLLIVHTHTHAEQSLQNIIMFCQTL